MFNSQKRRDKLEKADASNMKISTELRREADVTCHSQYVWTVTVIKRKQSVSWSVRAVWQSKWHMVLLHRLTMCGLCASQVVRGLEIAIAYCAYWDTGRKCESNGRSNEEEWDWRSMWRVWRTAEMHRGLAQKPLGKSHLEDPGVDWRIILK